jgi:CheY-like chemotaxis protein
MEIHQVLMNLCTNGALAMKPKGGVLTVELKECEVTEAKAASVPGLYPGPHVMLLVRDTGCGMIQEVRERVFDPFFTTRREGEGQGMGLSVVHGIVCNAGGGIEVDSEVGVGSTFRVYWPRIEPEQCEEVVGNTALPTGTERVLFVDDEEFQVSLARKMLGALGYQVTALASSPEALKLFKDNPQAFDLVVTDITMPGMTGIDFTRELLSVRPDIPVIMCTGYSELITGDDPSCYGARALVAKPVVMREMAETMRRVIDLTEGRR